MSKEDCFHLGVKGLLFNPKNQLLLLKRPRHENWDLPGGRVQVGETTLETLSREIQEETGYQNIVDPMLFDMTLTNIRIPLSDSEVGLIYAVYRCEVEAFTPLLSTEHIDFGWFAPHEAAQKLLPQCPPTFLEKLQQHNYSRQRNF